MGRCVVGAVVLALAGSAAAGPIDRRCDCIVPRQVVPHDRATVPRNAKLWTLGVPHGAVRIDRLDADWHDSLTGNYNPNLGTTLYEPSALAPGRYAIAYADVPAGTFDVEDRVDTTPPDRPELDGAQLEVDGSGRVTRLALTARFDQPDDTAIVRITVSDDNQPAQTVATTPDRLELCGYDLRVHGKLARITVTAIDVAGNASQPTTLELAPTPSTTKLCSAVDFKCGLGPTMMYLFAGIVILPILFIITVVAVFRRVNRGTTGEPPTILTNLVATSLAKHARARDGAYLAVVGFLLAAALMKFGEWGSIGGVWVALRFWDYVVAARALSLLERGAAIAELYGTNLVVRADGKQSAVLLSRGEIKHAKRNAVPIAKIP